MFSNLKNSLILLVIISFINKNLAYYNNVANNKSGLIEILLNNIRLFDKYNDDHDHDHDHDHSHDGLPPFDWFIDQIFVKYSNNTNNQTIGLKDLEDIMIKLDIKTGYHDHDHNHDHKNNNKIIFKKNNDNFSICYTGEQLFDIFHLHDKNQSRITKDLFNILSPALIWMGINEKCKTDDHDHEHGHTNCFISNKEKYLFGSLSVFVIWFSSLICVSIVGKFNKTKEFLILSLKALAIGTLLSDSLLHIIPAALGLHSHDESEHHHDHDSLNKRGENDPIWKMCGSMGTIFFLWIVESFFHHHQHHDLDHNHNDEVKNIEENYKNIESNSSSTNTIAKAEFIPDEASTIVKIKTKKTTAKSFIAYIKSIHPSGWIAFFGDLLHKMADGFAIGAAFSESLSLGFSTSMAILFHEIPHELGDYAVLLTAGFGHYTVLILNTITSGFGYISFLILASVSPDELVREWIFTITAGVFLYIALVNMVPRLKAEFEPVNGVRSYKRVSFILFFFLFGWLMMLLLAIYEEDIKFDVKTNC